MSLGKYKKESLDNSIQFRTINRDILAAKLYESTTHGTGVKLPKLTISHNVDQRNYLFKNSYEKNPDILKHSYQLDKSTDLSMQENSSQKLDRSNSNVVLDQKLRKLQNQSRGGKSQHNIKSKLDYLNTVTQNCFFLIKNLE